MSRESKKGRSDTRAEYPALPRTPCYAFYTNSLPGYPDPDTIDDQHRKHRFNLLWLETSHHYIQWWFPNRVAGRNPLAPVLNDDDVAAIRCDNHALE